MLGQHPVDAADDSSNRVLWVIRQVINGFPVVVQDIAAQIHNAHMHVVTLQAQAYGVICLRIQFQVDRRPAAAPFLPLSF